MTDRSGDEQIETLKNWWSDNGTATLGVILLGVVGVFGYQAWQSSVVETGEAASAVYEDLMDAVEGLEAADADEELEATANNLVETLREEYGDSAYAVLGALHGAKLAAMKQDYRAAEEQYNWVLEQDIEAPMEVIVRQRLARVLAARGKLQAGLDQLDEAPAGKSQMAGLDDIRGDILVAMGETEQAKQAYERALEAMEDKDERPYIAMKLANLPIVEVDEPVEEEDEEGMMEEGMTDEDAMEEGAMEEGAMEEGMTDEDAAMDMEDESVESRDASNESMDSDDMMMSETEEAMDESMDETMDQAMEESDDTMSTEDPDNSEETENTP